MKEHKKTKDKLIKAAINQFADKGFEGASIREIGAEAEINNTMISYHFGSKKKLYEACIDYVYNVSREKMAVIEYEIEFAQENNLSADIWYSILKKMFIKRITFFADSKTRNLYMFLLRSRLPKVRADEQHLDRDVPITHKIIGRANGLEADSPEVIKKGLVIMSLIHALIVSEYIVLYSFGYKKYTPKFIEEYAEFLLKEAIINK